MIHITAVEAQRRNKTVLQLRFQAQADARIGMRARPRDAVRRRQIARRDVILGQQLVNRQAQLGGGAEFPHPVQVNLALDAGPARFHQAGLHQQHRGPVVAGARVSARLFMR